MSAADDERLLRDSIGAYSRGDYDAALAGFHPDVEWSLDPDLVPDAAVYHGHAGVRRFWGQWGEVFEGMSIEVEECYPVEPEGCLLAVTRASGTGAGSGAAVASPRFAQLTQFRDGQVVRVKLFGDVSRALAAAGDWA